MKFYVYILADRGTPFYIGKGSDDRAYVHEKIVTGQLKRTDNSNPYRSRKIKKILREGRKIEYQFVFYSDNEEEALAKEKELITFYGRSIDGGILTNIHPGGVGGDTFSHLPPERQKLRRENLRKAAAKITSEQREAQKEKAKITNKLKPNGTSNGGLKHSLESKRKMRLARKGKRNGPSPKRGKPAIGRGAKGVKKAWNKCIDKNDSRFINLKKQVQTFHKNNPNAFAKLTYKLISPSGEIVEGIGIKSLIEKYPDISSRISFLINGKVSYYNGWIRFEDKDKPILNKFLNKCYDLINPNGERVKGVGLNKLVKQFGLSRKRLERLLKREIEECDGWRLFNT